MDQAQEEVDVLPRLKGVDVILLRLGNARDEIERSRLHLPPVRVRRPSAHHGRDVRSPDRSRGDDRQFARPLPGCQPLQSFSRKGWKAVVVAGRRLDRPDEAVRRGIDINGSRSGDWMKRGWMTTGGRE